MYSYSTSSGSSQCTAADLCRRYEVKIIKAVDVEVVLCQWIRFKLCRPVEEENIMLVPPTDQHVLIL